MLLYFFGLCLLITQACASKNQTIEEIPESYVNATDNSLWKALLKNCKNPTMQCVEKNIYKYLKQVLEFPKDYNVTSFLKFAKNSVNYTRIENVNNTNLGESEQELDENVIKGKSSIEELSKTLRDKGVQFLMTHDLELKMPELFFDGAMLKIAPKSFDGSGALVKMELLPQEISEARGDVEGRIFFKKIKKKIGDKLLYALLAILVVIKLLAVKFIFFLPALMGVAAAKKLIIKIIFFVFPAIKHLFKLCPYVPQSTKYHHHKHQIAHVHHIGGHKHHPHHHDDGVEVIHPHSDGPPIGVLGGGASLHHFVDIETSPHSSHTQFYKPHEHDSEYYAGGPGVGEDIITHRKDPDNEENEIVGQGHGRPTKKNRPLTATEIENMILKAEKEALIKAKLQQDKKRIQEENARLQEQLRQAMKLQEQLKLKQMGMLTQPKPMLMKNSLPTVPSPFLQSPPPPPDQALPMNSLFNIPNINQVVRQNVLKYTGLQPSQPVKQPAVSNPGMTNPGPGAQVSQGMSMVSRQGSTASGPGYHPSSQGPVTGTGYAKAPQANSEEEDFQMALNQAASITYDPFYTPILQSIDKTLGNLGYTDEPCKERLICFMYKNPEKYSPHSNIVSNELSRDEEELQKPKSTNAAVVRFYRYVQAARDGQEMNNCIKLYPGCDVLGSEL